MFAKKSRQLELETTHMNFIKSFIIVTATSAAFTALGSITDRETPISSPATDIGMSVRAVVKAQEAAWNRGDIDGYNSYAQRGNLPVVEDVCEGGMALLPMIGGRARVKLRAVTDARLRGVATACVADGRGPHPLFSAMAGAGTWVR